jgi:hypothetical protein
MRSPSRGLILLSAVGMCFLRTYQGAACAWPNILDPGNSIILIFYAVHIGPQFVGVLVDPPDRSRGVRNGLRATGGFVDVMGSWLKLDPPEIRPSISSV